MKNIFFSPFLFLIAYLFYISIFVLGGGIQADNLGLFGLFFLGILIGLSALIVNVKFFKNIFVVISEVVLLITLAPLSMACFDKCPANISIILFAAMFSFLFFSSANVIVLMRNKK